MSSWHQHVSVTLVYPVQELCDGLYIIHETFNRLPVSLLDSKKRITDNVRFHPVMFKVNLYKCSITNFNSVKSKHCMSENWIRKMATTIEFGVEKGLSFFTR